MLLKVRESQKQSAEILEQAPKMSQNHLKDKKRYKNKVNPKTRIDKPFFLLLKVRESQTKNAKYWNRLLKFKTLFQYLKLKKPSK